ncbi:multicopper oxidase family protein [Mechercharimyces sp. CAU 1602]|uniref:multicopper oxidase family protein n=1 Tax=Mechercharimyces sp. CAU 1602 TaxID=2973933 RepID=UPI002162CAF4|nr:multicopper oxidase [Mechercharimyces sp. CAU 1602]MCS1351066.1 multicopper oxidase [Mechercharimyces sp. CAU 1602]
MEFEKFVNPLPIPPVIQPFKKKRLYTSYRVEMREGKHQFDRSLPPSTIWGYNGIYPGPTFNVRVNERVRVKWINNLPDQQFLPVDTTVLTPAQKEILPITGLSVVHLHGGRTQAVYDGFPTAWYSKNLNHVGPTFFSDVFEYLNGQRPTTLMYHDHAFALTRLNVYAGLFGFYIIRSLKEEALVLPRGDFEMPLVIQDKSFNLDGSLFYPDQPVPNPSGIIPSIVPEFFGDNLLVNGKLYPYLEVEPRKYRFRILNLANARFFRMRLSSQQPFIQIGSDGGLLAKPVRVEELLLGPAERADVIIDFSGNKGEAITITNDAPSPFPTGTPVNSNTNMVMQFRVTLPLSSRDGSRIPSVLSRITPLKKTESINTRDITLDESTDQFGRLKLLLNNTPFADFVTITPTLNTVEVWRFINTTPDSHPIHVHLVEFQILHRQNFDVNRFTQTGELIFTSEKILPAPNERGFKDTVRADPGQVTTIIARYGPFSGRYVLHCHIIEHEDWEMMRPFDVIDDFEE